MNILDLIFPKSCLECGKGGIYICESCLNKVPTVSWHSKDTFSVWRYTGVIRSAILSLKYKYSTEIAKEIAENAIKKLKNSNFKIKNGVLIPIPLFKTKQNLRGFNQSEEVGKLVAKEMCWEFIPNLLLKKKQTKSQTELKGDERRENLKGVFEINPIYDPQKLKDKALIIFDDVYTTGSTLKEAKEVLKGWDMRNICNVTISR